MPENIHPVTDKLLDRPTKELSLGSALVFFGCAGFQVPVKHPCKRAGTLFEPT